MKGNQKEPKLTYALNALGRMVHIGSVERGLSCNCRCPKCNESLVAKLGHEGGRQAHFAHKKDSDCHGSYMTALHKLAEQIIEEEKAVMAPEYKEVAKQRLSFIQVEIEQRVERKDLQPDVVGVTEDGLRWIIEIRNTHEVDEAKKAKLIESDITCLEIDVREQTLENLKSFILESTDNREWINNPNYDAQILEAKRKRVSKVEKFLLCCTELTIPAYEEYDSRKISVKEAFVLTKAADGLFSQVKVLSSDGEPFVLNIGGQDILLTNIHRKHETDCYELIIVTDSISLEDEICSDALEMSWLYHFLTEKKREEKAKEYRNNSKYEVRLSSDCIFECKYRPFKGECIYKKETFTLKGICHIICNKEKRLKDEDEYQSHHRNRDDSFVSDKSAHDINNIYRNDNIKRTLHARKQIIKQNIEKSKIHSQETSTSENLPFEKVWIIEEYYGFLTSSNSYETGKGCFAEIAKCDKVGDTILLLYKEPVEVRTFTPYHIAVITSDNGNLTRNDVAVFTNKNLAMNSYYGRLSSLRNSMCSQSAIEIYDKDLPF
jgi:hypothetical protein